MIDLSRHHAYLAVGDRQALLPAIKDLMDQLAGAGLAITSDKMVWERPTWTIDDSRMVKDWQALSSQSGVKAGVIVCDNLSAAAGEALLKVVEEPAPGVKIFIIIPDESLLPPTLRSRLFKLDNLKVEPESAVEAAKFLSEPPIKRLKQLDGLADHDAARRLVESLERELAKRHGHVPANVFTAAGQILQEALKNVGNIRMPVKLTLETMALSLPQIMV